MKPPALRHSPRSRRPRTVVMALLGASALAVLSVAVVEPARRGDQPGRARTGLRGPGQRVFGDAVVTVICPGPALSKGHPASGQVLEVLSPPPPVAYGVKISVGLTGTRGRAIVARFSDDPSQATTFHQYFTSKPIPTSLLLPCSGTGTVVFRPSPGSPDARTSVVSVSYLNPAAGPTSRSRSG